MSPHDNERLPVFVGGVEIERMTISQARTWAIRNAPFRWLDVKIVKTNGRLEVSYEPR